MCGIVGVVGKTDEAMIRKMAETLIHRGPNDEGFHFGEGIGLGHRRLSIIDLHSGRQPISDSSDSLWLVCNGEIYNSPKWRQHYEAKGYQFKTKTDVEVILPLYQEFGDKCVEKLQGMFGFALWDSNKKRMLLARDHLGQKPVFFSKIGDQLVFGSEVKAVLASGLIKPELDMNGLWHYISLRYLPEKHTLFKGIEKIPAGHYVTFEQGKIEFTKYWQLDFKNKKQGSAAELTDALDEQLQKTVQSHLLSDVQVGAFLSGGIDSSTISAVMAQKVPDPIPVFSIGVKEHDFNELPYARMAAQKYNMDAHEKIVEANLIGSLPEMIWHLDEPSDPFAFGVYLVAREAAKKVKVVLTGDGGDESFAGYDRFAGHQMIEQYTAIPQWIRRQVIQRAINVIPESFGYKSLRQKADWFNNMSYFEGGTRYAESCCYLRFSQTAKMGMFSDKAKLEVDEPNSINKILNFFDDDSVADHAVDKMLYTDLMTRIPGHLLPIVDRMTMAHSLESRAPLMDYEFVEFAASLPANLKLKGRELKHILKQVALKHLPEELIYRKKQGFSFPLARWMRDELRPFITALFQNSRFVELGIFKQEFLDNMYQEHLDGNFDHNFRLWIIINLELWYRIFFDNMTIEQVSEEIQTLSGNKRAA